MLKAVIAFVAVLILGMLGLVVHKEMNRVDTPAARGVDEDEDVAVISHGEQVDIDRHIASKGLTLVEFYGVF